ncbi:MAG: Crp/Fnr family transcriptional regulator [Cyclobacteriaceae bacterium]|nr:Crp/Fnr family transcriptional regulator [Cyclobacteriaceae bacterium]
MSLFAVLSEAELERLNQDRQYLEYREGDYIYREGMRPEYLICLNEGSVKVTRYTHVGKLQVTDIMRNVEFLGFPDLMSGQQYQTSGIAINKVSVCLIPRAAFERVLSENPEFSLLVIRSLSRQLQQADHRLASLTQKHLRGRLADALLMLNDVFGADGEAGFINISLKRSDLASLANMDTSNASRILSELAREGIIHLDNRNIQILHADKLLAYSRRS